MGNRLQTSGSVVVDLVPPTLTLSGGSPTGVANGASAVTVLSPNGDRVGDTVSFVARSSEAGTADVTIRDAAGTALSTTSTPLNGRTATLTWDGTMGGGVPLPDGVYTLEVTTSDLAGNASAPQSRLIVLDRTLGYVTTSTSVFYPQDGDAFAATAMLGFRLAGPATVDWKIVNASGDVVRTMNASAAMDAGAYAFTWDGRNDAGAYVAPGAYVAQVTAVDAVAAVTQRVAVVADAFRIVSTSAAPARGGRITVTAYAAEPLAAAPTLQVAQPGIARWSVTLTYVSGNVYRSTITLRRSAAGTVTLAVVGTDAAGGPQASVLRLPLR
jgi:flagellar hook assembly protein FlgD